MRRARSKLGLTWEFWIMNLTTRMVWASLRRMRPRPRVAFFFGRLPLSCVRCDKEETRAEEETSVPLFSIKRFSTLMVKFKNSNLHAQSQSSLRVRAVRIRARPLGASALMWNLNFAPFNDTFFSDCWQAARPLPPPEPTQSRALQPRGLLELRAPRHPTPRAARCVSACSRARVGHDPCPLCSARQPPSRCNRGLGVERGPHSSVVDHRR